MRNGLAHAGRSGRRVVVAFIAAAFGPDDVTVASQQWRRGAVQLRLTVLEFAALMDAAKTDVLAHMIGRTPHRTKLHSIKPLERLIDEVNRRTEVAGIFPNEAAITRFVGAILLKQDDEWAVQRARHHAVKRFADQRCSYR